MLVQRATGSAAINSTFTFTSDTWLDEIRFHADGAWSNNSLTITVDSAAGAVYDTVLDSVDLNGLTDEVWQPTRPHYLFAGDSLILAATNGNSDTYGIEVYHR